MDKVTYFYSIESEDGRCEDGLAESSATPKEIFEELKRQFKEMTGCQTAHMVAFNRI